MITWANTPFEPWAGLAGGILIGCSVVLLLFTIGRIAGISGAIAGMFTKQRVEKTWRIAFIGGLMLSTVIYQLFVGDFPVITQQSSVWMIVAGLLVGFGTRLGSGCTSGHGVAGIARLSSRSIVATLCFIGFAVATVSLFRHINWGG
ncbi:YeeE/YedE thiosulfate transporter family protein [Alteromonas ponticola]|uniref:YeeE/YedE thiosulfate transporter family protein n=1 Tax=Alteromonas aquimaris TaxID=2998417 RepID=A0ABT3PAD3_9ALTE|nr:YeeE/YedE thiosulfate transporter family protein [Alteromonas aquimaris]MCW8109732.1 YeeE/YedE thiosulfate transporter family protein [Alteromonas aquimaris]